MDALSFIMDYESGNCTEEEIAEGFQQLIDSRLIFQLQGSYLRAAQQLIDAGIIHHSPFNT